MTARVLPIQFTTAANPAIILLLAPGKWPRHYCAYFPITIRFARHSSTAGRVSGSPILSTETCPTTPYVHCPHERNNMIESSVQSESIDHHHTNFLSEIRLGPLPPLSVNPWKMIHLLVNQALDEATLDGTSLKSVMYRQNLPHG